MLHSINLWPESPPLQLQRIINIYEPPARVDSVEDTHILVDDDDTSGGVKWPESIPAGHTPSAPLPIVSPPGGQSDAVHPEAY